MDKKFGFMKGMDLFSASVLFIGGINWGLVGFFNFDLVAATFGNMSVFSRIVYCLVGICAVYEVVMWRTIQRRWGCSLWPRSAEAGAA